MKGRTWATCRCGHNERHHQAEDAEGNLVPSRCYGGVEDCLCRRFRKAAPDRPRRQRIVRRAKDWEREVAASLEGQRLVTSGRKNLPDVVVYGADGTELLAIECKEYERITLALLESALAQAQAASLGRRGSPWPAVAAKEKRGLGKACPRRVYMAFADYAALVRLARGNGER